MSGQWRQTRILPPTPLPHSQSSVGLQTQTESLRVSPAVNFYQVFVYLFVVFVTPLAMTGVDERQAFAKLEALKDIRTKTICLEKTRVSLLVDVGQLEEEERCLEEYRRELELLQQVR